MATYTNTSKSASSYNNTTKTRSSILVYLATEDGDFMTQEDDGYLVCETTSGDNEYTPVNASASTYSYLSK